jgi:hypothetical protein
VGHSGDENGGGKEDRWSTVAHHDQEEYHATAREQPQRELVQLPGCGVAGASSNAVCNANLSIVDYTDEWIPSRLPTILSENVQPSREGSLSAARHVAAPSG